jgi:pSer/pThr/pTyr-binding forkhead associated (FHA) protein
MPKLQVTLPDGSEVTHELTEDVITIGRISDNTIQIEDASVSSHHAELVMRDGDYAMRDLGSTNGSAINGKKVEPEQELQLQGNDQIRLGSIEVVYLSETPSENVRPLPTEAEPSAAPAQSSIAPTDFSNASPFRTKNKKKDPAAAAIMGFALLAMLLAVGAMAMVMGLRSPL